VAQRRKIAVALLLVWRLFWFPCYRKECDKESGILLGSNGCLLTVRMDSGKIKAVSCNDVSASWPEEMQVPK
jgi:hypothetical protein